MNVRTKKLLNIFLKDKNFENIKFNSENLKLTYGNVVKYQILLKKLMVITMKL